jgi:2-iminobutanoate/2-iminopropanoate deaminase
MTTARRVNVDGVARLPAFAHATMVGGQIFVSGTLGTTTGSLDLVPGGVAAQTTQALRNIEVILAACGARLRDIAKVNVYLTDMATFDEMNQAYVATMGDDPPTRITVGCAALALDAAVEIDCVAFVTPESAG